MDANRCLKLPVKVFNGIQQNRDHLTRSHYASHAELALLVLDSNLWSR